jgi:uncharacterized protein
MAEPTAQIKIRVIPRAKRTEWGGKRGESRVVRLQAAPVKGAANDALIAFLHKELGVSASALEIVHGDKDRDKIVRVQGMRQAALDKLLG